LCTYWKSAGLIFNLGECMRRKIKDSVIENLECVCHCFLALSTLISFLSICFILFFTSPRDMFFTSNVGIIVLIWFLISLICFAVNEKNGFLKFLHKRNEKIDEEEKARQQALLLEAEERNRAELQIWVSE